MMKLLSSVALATLLAGTAAVAADQTDKQTNSGPGVQGAPDTRTGPSTKGSDDSSSAGASSGAAGEDVGTGKQTGPGAGKTDPSQDASGVSGAPGNKNSPAAEPSDTK